LNSDIAKFPYAIEAGRDPGSAVTDALKRKKRRRQGGGEAPPFISRSPREEERAIDCLASVRRCQGGGEAPPVLQSPAQGGGEDRRNSCGVTLPLGEKGSGGAREEERRRRSFIHRPREEERADETLRGVTLPRGTRCRRRQGGGEASPAFLTDPGRRRGPAKLSRRNPAAGREGSGGAREEERRRRSFIRRPREEERTGETLEH